MVMGLVGERVRQCPRAEGHWQGSSGFYGPTWVSVEVGGQSGSKLSGSVTLKVNF